MSTRVNRRSLMKSSAIGLATSLAGSHLSFAAAQELEPAELRFYFGANPEEGRARQDVIDAFQKKFPQITIKPQFSEGDPLVELQTQFAGGDAPDIIMGWTSYPGLAKRGLFMDLTPFLSEESTFLEQLTKDLSPLFLKMFQFEGKQMILPEQYTGVVIMYNKKLLDDAGVTDLPTSWDDASWTYDAFLDLAKTLTKKDGDRINQFGFTDSWWTPLTSLLFGINNGGAWFDNDYLYPTRCTASDPKLIEGVQFFADLANVHHVSPNAEQSQTQAGPDMFMASRAALTLTGHWMYRAFTSVEGLEFDIAPLPHGNDESVSHTNMDATGLGIGSQTKYPRQAWEFLKFCAGTEGQNLEASSGLFVPVRTSSREGEEFAGAHTAIEHESVWIDSPDYGVQQPVSDFWNEIQPVWVRAVERITSGSAQAADELPKMETEINVILKG